MVVISYDSYRFATRSRKAALRYQCIALTKFIGLSGAGRIVPSGSPGTFDVDGVSVTQLYVRRPRPEPTRRNQLFNVVVSYFPAFIRMAKAVLTSPADVVHVTGSPLVLLGLLHRARFRSHVVLDLPERPGLVSHGGSVMAFFRPLERRVLRVFRRWVFLVTVVTYADLETVAKLGYKRVRLVRNVPLSGWRAGYVPPSKAAGGCLIAVSIGSIFEGRGYETLLRAIARAKNRRSVRLKIYGSGRREYVSRLKKTAEELGIADVVEWMGSIDPAEVSAAYLDAHIGLVLYDPRVRGNDGLSNKLLECVSSGRPVLAADLPENRRFVLEHGIGWLTSMTEDGLAAALVDGVSSSDIEAISARCRRLGDGWLNWEREFGVVLDALSEEFCSSVYTAC